MLRTKRIEVGTKPVDLVADTVRSGVTISYLRNAGKTVLYLGSVGCGIPLAPGEALQSFPDLAPADAFPVVRKDGKGPVDVILGYAI